MPRYNPVLLVAALLAGLGLALGSGCASSQQGNARWLQRGEAEALLAAHSATAEKTPDLDRMPNGPSEMEAQGDIMAAQGAPLNAMSHYRQALRDAKGDSRLRLEGKLAGLELSLGRYKTAQEGFSRLCRAQPGKAVFWQGLGLAQLGQSDLAGAEKSLSRAVILNPSLWRAQNLLGVVHNRRRQPQLAMANFQAALLSRPDKPALYNNLALAQAMAGDLRGAEASLRRALALDPEHRLAANNLGLLLVRQGRDDEAYQIFAQAQGVAQAHNNLGVILAWQGRTRQAQEQFRLAVQALPRHYPLAARHLKQLGAEAAPPPGAMLARPMTPLTERASSQAQAPSRPKATARAAVPAPAPAKPVVKLRSKAATNKKAPAKAQASTAKTGAVAAAQAPSGSKPAAEAKPVPQAKPAPLSKQQRMASDAAPSPAAVKPQPIAEKAAVKPPAAPAKPEAAPTSGAARPAPAPLAAVGKASPSPSPMTGGRAAGLWMRADGSVSYGPMPDGEKAYGVVYGTGN